MQDWNGPAFTGHIVERAGVHDFSRDFSQGDDGERKGSASGQGRADRLNGNEDKIGADVDTFVREAQDEVSIMCVCVGGGGVFAPINQECCLAVYRQECVLAPRRARLSGILLAAHGFRKRRQTGGGRMLARGNRTHSESYVVVGDTAVAYGECGREGVHTQVALTHRWR